MFSSWAILIAIPSELFLDDKASFIIAVQYGVVPVVWLEGLCHILEGGVDCSLHQLDSISFSESSLSHGLSKCWEYDILLEDRETLEVGFFNSNAKKERYQTFECASLLLFVASTDAASRKEAAELM